MFGGRSQYYGRLEPLLRQELALARKKGEAEDVVDCMRDLGRFLMNVQSFSEAEEILQEGKALSSELGGWERFGINREFTRLYLLQDRLEDAQNIGEETYRHAQSFLGKQHGQTLFCARDLALAYSKAEQYAEAEPLLLQVFAAVEEKQQASQTKQAIQRLISLYRAWGKPEKAAEWRAKLAETEEEPEAK